ncbi:tumor necrosis factor-like [Trachinotus anak]|uniref:tumor necrosis factor-like n=1 Tax=Trachinotus anak TaxID=443729 RepID=UPI0039F1A870
MEGECKVQLDATVDTEARKQTTQGVKHNSKLTTALLVFTLCLAAAAAAVLIFNTHTKGPRQDENNFALRHSLRQISDGRAAIHLEGKFNDSISNSVEWKDNVDQSHSQGDLKLDNNEIVIPQQGLYFVYSQASFRVSCNDPDNTTPGSMVHLSHTVQRWSSSYESDNKKRSYHTIMHSVRTACQKTAGDDRDDDGNWYTAVYMGAVFNLRKDDRLKTVMEKRMLEDLEDESGKTFFGVFAL